MYTEQKGPPVSATHVTVVSHRAHDRPKAALLMLVGNDDKRWHGSSPWYEVRERVVNGFYDSFSAGVVAARFRSLKKRSLDEVNITL